MGKVKLCKDCGSPRDHNNPLISRCKACYRLREKTSAMRKGLQQVEIKRTPVARVWKKRKERIKNQGSEVGVYEKVYAKQKHCTQCSKRVTDPKPWCFAHILNKKDYPHLRLFENNIAFVCSPECHSKVDSKIVGQNKKDLEARILKGEEIIL